MNCSPIVIAFDRDFWFSASVFLKYLYLVLGMVVLVWRAPNTWYGIRKRWLRWKKLWKKDPGKP